jgi:hypothetical protein
MRRASKKNRVCKGFCWWNGPTVLTFQYKQIIKKKGKTKKKTQHYILSFYDVQLQEYK